MSTPSHEAGAVRRALFTRYTLLAFLTGAAVVAGAGTLARAQGISGWHHAMMMGASQNSADFSSQMEHGLQHLYVDLQATDAQKAQIDPMVKQAISDLQSLHAQQPAPLTQVTQALAQTPVDRSALEAARVAHLQLADQASRRLVQLVADVGDVLTPPQRKIFADHLAKMHAF